MGWGGERGAEFAGDEEVEGAEAAGEFVGGDAALAMEPAEKVRSGAASLQGIALDTAGDEIAIGIVLGLDTRDDVVEGTHGRVEAAPAIKTEAAFAAMDGFAKGAVLQEIQLIEVAGASGA